jgi:N-acetylmuramoyl-L-alanine amidase
MKLCINPGHGGHDSGVVGLGGLRESDLNLAIAGRVATLAVMNGWDVMMTRSSDRFVGLREQADLANESSKPVDLFLALHGNGATNREAHGVEFFTSRGETASDAVVPHLAASWVAAFPNETIRSDWADGDVDKEAGYAVLHLTHTPAVLVEVGFVSHPPTEKLLRTSEYQDRIARAIVAGLNAWRASIGGAA